MSDDLRLGLRSLSRRPALAAATLATLALGIGSTTALFSVAWAYVLGPSSLPHSERLLVGVERANDGSTMPVDLPTAGDWQAAPALASAGVFERSEALVGRAGEVKVPTAFASSGFFAALAVPPARGRLFVAADDESGSGPSVVLSDGGWRRLTQADPDVLGRTLVLNGLPSTVIGVLPPAFRFGSRVDVWRSLGTWKLVLPPDVAKSRAERSLTFVARLAPGASAAGAQAQLAAISARLAAQFAENAGVSPSTRPLVGYLAEDTRSGLLLLLAAVGLLLLVSCFNLAVLWLVRARGRQRELAVRRALGAGRLQLLRLLGAESMLVCLLGGVLGVGTAALGVRLLERWLPLDVVAGRAMAVEPAAAAAALATALVVGLLFGLLPLLDVGRSGFAQLRSARGSRETRDSSRLGAFLVAAEVAGATALLQVGGLLALSLLRLLAVDPGFEPSRALTAALTLSTADSADAATTTAAWERVIAAIAASGNVAAVGATTHPPLGPSSEMNLEVEGLPPGPGGQQPLVAHSEVAGELFAALGVRVVAGRAFDGTDQRVDAVPTVVVNETLARRYWPGQTAVGKRLRWAIPGAPAFPWRTVVGVVGDTRDYGIGEQVKPAAFFPYHQLPAAYLPGICRQMTLVARSRRGAPPAAAALRRTLQQVAPSATPGTIAPLAETVARSLSQPRLYARLTAAFAAAALMLAALGIHGVLAARIAERRQEIGVRLAIGARPAEIRRLVFRLGLRLTVWGLLAGVPLGLGASALVARLLYDTSPLDLRLMAAVACIVAAMSLSGCVFPARRAAATSPARALLHD